MDPQSGLYRQQHLETLSLVLTDQLAVGTPVSFEVEARGGRLPVSKKAFVIAEFSVNSTQVSFRKLSVQPLVLDRLMAEGDRALDHFSPNPCGVDVREELVRAWKDSSGNGGWKILSV